MFKLLCAVFLLLLAMPALLWGLRELPFLLLLVAAAAAGFKSGLRNETPRIGLPRAPMPLQAWGHNYLLTIQQIVG
jgi:hypothetical protein